MQLLFRIFIQHIRCGLCLALVHSHVKRGIKANGKTASGFIKLVTAHTQVRKYSIHFPKTIEAKKAMEVTEVLRNKNDPVIGRNILLCICILVKSYQPSIFIQLLQDGLAMTAAAKGAVNIYA